VNEQPIAPGAPLKKRIDFVVVVAVAVVVAAAAAVAFPVQVLVVDLKYPRWQTS